MKKKAGYDSVVFAGGGSRCLWQAGFWDELVKSGRFKPDRIACVSAGSAVACMLVSGRVKEGLGFFKDITGKNKKNFYPERIFTGKPAFPHAGMYRDVILYTVGSRELKKLHCGPEILVLLARPPRLLGPRSATLVGMGAYNLERRLRNPVHPDFASRLGFTAEVVPVSRCRTPEELADLILASSCTPPFVPVAWWDGKISLDGGLIDNVPVQALGDETRGNTLVLLTRKYPEERIPKIPGRTYIQPSVPIPITKWDYTNPRGLQEAFDLGKKDAKNFLKKSKL